MPDQGLFQEFPCYGEIEWCDHGGTPTGKIHIDRYSICLALHVMLGCAQSHHEV